MGEGPIYWGFCTLPFTPLEPLFTAGGGLLVRQFVRYCLFDNLFYYLSWHAIDVHWLRCWDRCDRVADLYHRIVFKGFEHLEKVCFGYHRKILINKCVRIISRHCYILLRILPFYLLLRDLWWILPQEECVGDLLFPLYVTLR